MGVPQMGSQAQQSLSQAYGLTQAGGPQMQNMYGQLLSGGGRNQFFDTMGEAGKINQANTDRMMQLALGAGGNPADVYAQARQSGDQYMMGQQNQQNQLNQQAIQNQFAAAQGMQGLPSYMLQPTSVENAFMQGVQMPAMLANQSAGNQASQWNAGQQNQMGQYNVQNQMDFQNLLAQILMGQANQQANLAQNSVYAYAQPSGFDQFITPLLGDATKIAAAYLGKGS